MEEPPTTTISPATWLRSRSLPSIVHALTLLAGLIVLLYLGREQWFFFDEWDIIWPPEAERRLIEGHNGHWSVVPIAVWRLLQSMFGLGSYIPYLAVAVVTHLIVAHLLWRLMLRIGATPWIAVALTSVFIFLGSAPENLFWAFQMGFMGAIAFSLGALLIALREKLTPLTMAACAALLLLGAATAGTALPFFVAVGLTLLGRHGWRTAVATLAAPSVAYVFWYLFVAAPNPTVIYRADGIAASLEGIPEFIATMFVGGFDLVTPVSGFGIVITAAVALWAVIAVGRSPLRSTHVAVLGVLAAGVVFAALTAYSRLGLGLAAATESRYVYVIVVAMLPAIALVLTRLARGSAAREVFVLSLILVVGLYNLGALAGRAQWERDRENRTHQLISAALDIAAENPGAVDLDARPDPIYLPRTIAQLQSLEAEFGLTRVPYTESDRLTALANISLVSTPESSPSVCDASLGAGSVLELSGPGVTVSASKPTDVTVRLESEGETSDTITLSLVAGSNSISALEPVSVVIEGVDAALALCD